jgi:hypothetical protein
MTLTRKAKFGRKPERSDAKGEDSMPFCPNCGAEHAGAKFCPECGTPQPGADPPTQEQTPPAAAAPPPATGRHELTEETLWEAESKDLKHRASGGRVVPAHYKLTNRYLYFNEGVVSTKSEQIPLWAIRDIDVKQSFMQKRTGLGDVIVRVEHSDYTGRRQVDLKWVEEPTSVREQINREAHRERMEHDERKRTQLYGKAPPPSS